MFLDLVAVILLIYGLYVGYTRGIIKSVFAIISIFIGIIAAIKISPITINLLEKIFNIHPGFTFLLGFGLTFFLVMVAVRFIGKKLEDILQFAHVNFVNKAAGAAVMGLILLVFYSYALYGIDKIGLISANTKDKSVSYSFLSTLPNKTENVMTAMKPMFEGFYVKMKETFKKGKEYDQKEVTEQ